MKKIIRLTESDLRRIVKRVINESGDNDIEIPEEFEGVINELGNNPSPQEIIDAYNSEVEEGTPLVDYLKGIFYNENDEEIPLDVVLDELNYAITGEEWEEEEDEYEDEEF